jgi:hypothetical protein
VKSHHARKQHPRTGDVFHDDCWATTNDAIQADYLRRIGDEGLEGLLSPYVVTLPDVVAEPVHPEPRDEEPVEQPVEVEQPVGQFVATADGQVHVPSQAVPGQRPLAEAETV